MLTAILAGFLLGGSLIIAIGAQNAFVLRQGLLKQHVFPVALFCAVSDATLILLGVAGFGEAIKAAPALLKAVQWGGGAFLVWYGFSAFRRAMQANAMEAAEGGGLSLKAAIAQCAAFTWLNPHVYLDTVILVGGLSTTFGENRWWYAFGAATASFVWFFALAYGARLLIPVFSKPMAWRVLDIGIGCVMWLLAFKIVTTPL
ncbi:MAG: LysE/ArgO family amino acid transporter [Beijerinckiaceae bacterium]